MILFSLNAYFGLPSMIRRSAAYTVAPGRYWHDTTAPETADPSRRSWPSHLRINYYLYSLTLFRSIAFALTYTLIRSKCCIFALSLFRSGSSSSALTYFTSRYYATTNSLRAYIKLGDFSPLSHAGQFYIIEPTEVCGPVIPPCLSAGFRKENMEHGAAGQSALGI